MNCHRPRHLARCLVGAAAIGIVVLMAIANWHLFEVATASEPGCVAHRRLGSETRPNAYAAARSVCWAH